MTLSMLASALRMPVSRACSSWVINPVTKMPPAVAPRPYNPALEILRLVLCQLAGTWCSTLSSFAIRIPVAPTTRASHLSVPGENGDLMMWSSSSPMVLTAVPREPVKDFDGRSCGGDGASGSVELALATGVAESPSAACCSAPAFDHDGASNTNKRVPMQIEREICLRRTAIAFAGNFSRQGLVTYSAIRSSTGELALRFLPSQLRKGGTRERATDRLFREISGDLDPRAVRLS